MFSLITSVLARIELRGNQEAMDSVGSLLKEYSQVKQIIDSSMAKDQYMLDANAMSFDVENKAILKEILAITNVLKEMPAEMKEIIQELSFVKRDLVSDLKTGAYSFAVLFSDDPEYIKKLKGAETSHSMKLFISTDKAKAEEMGVSFPGVFCYNAVDKNSFVSPLPTSFQALQASLTVPAFTVINHENFRFLELLNQKLFYLIDNKRSFEECKELFDKSARLCAGFSRVLYFTPEDVPSLIPLLKITEEDYPVLVSFAREGKSLVRKVTADSFLQDLHALQTNQAERVKFSVALPENNDTLPVKIVNTDTLQSFTAAKESDVLVVFTSPTCKYCAQLEPVLQQLSSLFKEKNVSIVIGNYNVIENEEPTSFVIDGVPSLYFIKQGSEIHMPVPSSSRTLAKLLQYVAQEGESAKIDLSLPEFAALIKKEEEADKTEEENESNEEKEQFEEKEEPEENEIAEDIL